MIVALVLIFIGFSIFKGFLSFDLDRESLFRERERCDLERERSDEWWYFLFDLLFLLCIVN